MANKIKLLDSITGDGFEHDTDYELEVIECQCGFHIGLDSTFLDQVDCINIPCPSCHENIFMP